MKPCSRKIVTSFLLLQTALSNGVYAQQAPSSNPSVHEETHFTSQPSSSSGPHLELMDTNKGNTSFLFPNPADGKFPSSPTSLSDVLKEDPASHSSEPETVSSSCLLNVQPAPVAVSATTSLDNDKPEDTTSLPPSAEAVPITSYLSSPNSDGVDTGSAAFSHSSLFPPSFAEEPATPPPPGLTLEDAYTLFSQHHLIFEPITHHNHTLGEVFAERHLNGTSRYFTITFTKEGEMQVIPLPDFFPPVSAAPVCPNIFTFPAKQSAKTRLYCPSNNNFVMAVFQDPAKEKVIVQGQEVDAPAPVTIREIPGKYVTFLTDRSGRSSAYQAFLVHNASESLVDSKRIGHYIGIINLAIGNVIEVEAPFYIDTAHIENADVKFVGTDNALYALNSNSHDLEKELESPRLPIEDFGASAQYLVSYLKVRNASNFSSVYRLFAGDFDYELEENTTDVTSIVFLNGHYVTRNISSSTPFATQAFALVTKSTPVKPAQVYLRRWHESQPFFQAIPANRIDLWAEKLPRIHSLLGDIIKKEKTLDELRKEFKGTPPQMEEILLHDAGTPSTYTHFVAPYSIQVQNGNFSVPAHVWKGAGASPKTPKPVIFHIHGGPHVNEDPSFDAGFQYLATNGYTVVSPEPRGSAGYGTNHDEALIGDWGGGHISDIIAVKRELEKEPWINKSQMYLMGHSFGGFTVGSLVTNEHYLQEFQGAVALSGVYNLAHAMLQETQDDPWERDLESKLDYVTYWHGRFGFDSLEDHTRNEAVSPAYHIQRLQIPLMLIHGREDKTCYPEQAMELHRQAAYHNKPLYSVVIAGDEHSLLSQVGFSAYWDLSRRFFATIGNGTYQPPHRLQGPAVWNNTLPYQDQMAKLQALFTKPEEAKGEQPGI